MNVDFLPERVITGRAMRARVFRQGYLLGIMLAALFGLAYFNEERIGHAEAQMSGLDSRSANMTTQVNTMYTLQGQLSDLMIKQRIDNRLGSRINGMDILGELGRILPVSMTLTNLDLDTKMVSVKLKSDFLLRRNARPNSPRRKGRKLFIR